MSWHTVTSSPCQILCLSVCFDLTHTWPNQFPLCNLCVFFSCFACVRAFCTVTSLLFSPKKDSYAGTYSPCTEKTHPPAPPTHKCTHTNKQYLHWQWNVCFMIPLPLIGVVLVNVLWMSTHNAPGLGWGGWVFVWLCQGPHSSVSLTPTMFPNKWEIQLDSLKKPLYEWL